ncbi:MAG: heme-binding protein [Candidatus Thiodiazotropha taylori]
MNSKFVMATIFHFLSPFAATKVESDNASDLHSFRFLSLELAIKAAQGAVEYCRNQGYSVAVAVVDRGGNVQAQLRDRFAGPHTLETAFRKAWAANSFRQSTTELAGLPEEKRLPGQVSNNPSALLVGRGLVIEAGGEIVGGIGITGAPPGKPERDGIHGACAQAGIGLIREALEFAD